MNAPAATLNYSDLEERFNIASHALGAIAALIAGTILIVIAGQSASASGIVSVSIYAATLLLLYLTSVIYHASRQPKARARWKVADHCAIYLLIAGTYTPFSLVSLRGAWGWSLFGVVWGLALAGVIFKLFYTGRFKKTSTALYVAMGWVCVIAIVPLMRALSNWEFGWLIAGGVVYTLGTVFYLNKRIPYSHAIWHLFVLGGSACHFVAIYLIIMSDSL